MFDGSRLSPSLAGINISEFAPGFAELCVRPFFPDSLRWVEASVNTVRGRVASSWYREGDLIQWHLTLPANTQAQVVLPSTIYLVSEPVKATFCLGSGNHMLELVCK